MMLVSIKTRFIESEFLKLLEFSTSYVEFCCRNLAVTSADLGMSPEKTSVMLVYNVFDTYIL